MNIKQDLGLKQSLISGGDYFVYNFFAYGLWSIFYAYAQPFSPTFSTAPTSTLILFIISGFLFIWITFLTAIKRLRTVHLSHWWVLLLFVPFINILLILFL